MKMLFTLLLLFSYNLCAQTIALDIGHHNKDPGAISAYGNSEYSYNRTMTESIVEQMKINNHKVKIVNPTGKKISLQQRIVEADNASLFLSIHHDSVEQKDLRYWLYKGQRHHYNDNVKGFSIFVSTKNAYFEASLECATLIAKNLINNGFEPNYYHAQRSNPKQLFFQDLPVYTYDNLVVLRDNTMPAILVEAGVIVNRQEAITIKNNNIRIQFAQALTKSIASCIKH